MDNKPTDMKNIPSKIYLQIDADGETPEDFKELSGISWCTDKINKNDIEYHLATEIKGQQEQRVKDLEDGIKMFLAWLEKNRPTVAGLGAPIHLLKQLLNP